VTNVFFNLNVSLTNYWI